MCLLDLYCINEETVKLCKYMQKKKRNRLRMFHRVVWNHILPPDYAYQQCLWSSNKSSNVWRFMVTVVRNILNVSVFTLPYVWPLTNRKTSMALQLTHKPCPMIWNITLWIMRNTREPVCPGLLALVSPEKDSELNECLCSHKKDHCAWPRWMADV